MKRPGKNLIFALIVAVLALPVLTSCTVNPATGKQSFTACMPPEREKEVGRQEHEKILDQFGGVYDDPEVGAYIARIGGVLALNSEMPNLGVTFTVLNDSKVNAFAFYFDLGFFFDNNRLVNNPHHATTR